MHCMEATPLKLMVLVTLTHCCTGYHEIVRQATQSHYFTMGGNAENFLLSEISFIHRNGSFTYNRNHGNGYEQYGQAISTEFAYELQSSYLYKEKPQLSRDGEILFYLSGGSSEFQFDIMKMDENQQIQHQRTIFTGTFCCYQNNQLNWAVSGNSIALKRWDINPNSIFVQYFDREDPTHNTTSYEITLPSTSVIRYLQLSQDARTLFILYNNSQLQVYDVQTNHRIFQRYNVREAAFISNDRIIFTYDGTQLRYFQLNATRYPDERFLSLEASSQKRHFVVSKDYTHFGFVSKRESPLAINTEIFSLFKISDIVEGANETVVPEFRIIEVGTFLSIDVNENASHIGYIRSHGTGPQREFVLLERNYEVNETLYPCYTQFYAGMYPYYCGFVSTSLFMFGIVAVLMFLVVVIGLAVFLAAAKKRMMELLQAHEQQALPEEH